MTSISPLLVASLVLKAEMKISAGSEGILKSVIINSKLAMKKNLERMIIKYNLHVTKFGGKLSLD